jgi:hypothetical protein
LILAGVVGQDVGVSDVPSIVELLDRLAVMERALVQANQRIEALEAENAELRRQLGLRLQHTNRCATVLTCGFLLPLVRERRAATAGARGSSH